jgi:hypothetical protein
VAVPYDLYLGRIAFNDSNDRRPLIVLSTFAGDRVRVAMLSGNLDLFEPARDFLIEKGHPNFTATGLTRTSYVFGDYGAEVGLASLERRKGRIEGLLLDEFRMWWEIRSHWPR